MSQLPTDRPAVAPHSSTQFPAPWAGVLTREALPADLIWSGELPLPAIGERVFIRMNGFGAAAVNHYCHADGFIGVICTPEVLPDWFKKQSPGVTKVHVFGKELGPMPAEVPLSVLEAREEVDRKNFRSKQREARAQFPHDPELRKAHAEPARQAWLRAVERVEQARQRVEAGSADAAPA